MLTAPGLQRHLNLEVLLRAAAGPAWSAAGAFAAWRLLVGAWVPAAAVLAAGGALAATVALFRRSAWTRDQALVALDRAAGAGGLALTLAETPSPQWEPILDQHLAQATLPPRSLGRPALTLIGAAVFAVAAALAPRPVARLLPLQAAAQSHVADAAQAAEAVKAEALLDASLQAELERLAKEAQSGSFDASDWAALDAVAEALDQAASQRASDLAQAEMAARQLAEALDAKAGDEAEQRAREELESALAQLGSSGAGEQAETAPANPGPGQAKPGEGKPGSGQGRSAADAKQLAEALAARRSALEKGSGSQRLARSAQSGQGQGQGKGQGQGEGKGQGQGQSTSDGKTGQGGPSRGPGAAPVTFGPQHPIDPDQLLLQELDKNAEGDPTELEGIRRVAPKLGEADRGGSVGAATAGPDGLAPESAPLAPRHRELIKRYFAPPAAPKASGGGER